MSDHKKRHHPHPLREQDQSSQSSSSSASKQDAPVTSALPTQEETNSPKVGRPSGSGTLPSVTEIRAACPRCESFSSKIRTSRTDWRVSMKLPDGKMHSGVVFSYAVCERCGQRYMTRRPA
jgi:hypothetical protein